MEREEVKEIKACLDREVKDYQSEFSGMCLNYINELESENERLSKENYQFKQDLGQCENGYKLELHTARYQMQSTNEDLEKAKNRIAELEKENARLIKKNNHLLDRNRDLIRVCDACKISLKQFAERLKEKVKNFCGTEYENAYYDTTKSFACNDIDETLEEMINEKKNP